MSSEHRKRELRAEQEQREIEREQEEARRANMSMFEKITEAQDVHDLKEILFEIAEHVGL